MDEEQKKRLGTTYNFDNYLNRLTEDMKDIKQKGGYLEKDNIQALSTAMKLYIKESETRESSLQDRIHQLEIAKKENESNLETLSHFMRNQANNIDGNNRHTNQALQEKKQKIIELENLIKDNERDKSLLQNEQNRLVDKIKELKGALATKNEQMRDEEDRVKGELLEIHQEKESLKQKISRLENSISDQNRSIASLQEVEMELSKKVNEKEGILSVIKEKLIDANNNLKDMKSNLDSAEKANFRYQEQLKEAKNTSSSMEHKLIEISKKLSQQNLILNSSQNEASLLSKELMSVSNENSYQKETIVNLHKDNETLTTSLQKVDEEKRELESNLSILTKEAEDLKSKFVETENRLIEEFHFKTELEIELDHLNSKARSFEENNKKLSFCLSAAESKCTNYEKEKNSLQDNLQSITNAYEESKSCLTELKTELQLERKKVDQLQNDDKEKEKTLNELQNVSNENSRLASNAEKVNQELSLKLSQLYKKYQELQKCKDENATLEKKLMKSIDENKCNTKKFNTSLKKQKDEQNSLICRIDQLEQIRIEVLKENEQLNDEKEFYKQKKELFENKIEVLDNEIKNLKEERLQNLTKSKQLETEIQNINSSNKELSNKYNELIFANCDLEEHLKHYESNLLELTEQMKSEGKIRSLIEKENAELKDSLKENIEKNKKDLEKYFETDKNLSAMQNRNGSLEMELKRYEKDCERLRVELTKLNDLSQNLQTQLLEARKKNEFIKNENTNSSKETERLNIENINLTHEISKLHEELAASNKKEKGSTECVKESEKKIKDIEEELDLNKRLKNKLEVSSKSLSSELKKKSKEFDALMLKSEKLEDQVKLMNAEIVKGKDSIEERSSKIKCLIETNDSLKKENEEMTKNLKSSTQSVNELTSSVDKLNSELLLVNEKYEKSKNVETKMEKSLKEFKHKNSEFEMENNKLKMHISGLKQKINDQQQIINEFDYKETCKLERKKSEEHEIIALKSLNSSLQSEINQMKEEVSRLKIGNEKFREDFSAKKSELDSVVIENDKLKRENLNLHNPCRDKITGLECKINSLRERESHLKNMLNKIKNECDALCQVNYELQCNIKYADQEFQKLNEEYDGRKASEEEILKKRENDQLTINKLKNEYINVVNLLKRVKKNHDCLKILVKTVEDEKIQLKLQNQQLLSKSNSLNKNLSDAKNENMKYVMDIQKLRSCLSLMKFTEQEKQTEYKELCEKLKQSEQHIQAFLKQQQQKDSTQQIVKETECVEDIDNTYQLQLKKLLKRCCGSEERKGNSLEQLLSEFKDLSLSNQKTSSFSRDSSFSQDKKENDFNSRKQHNGFNYKKSCVRKTIPKPKPKKQLTNNDNSMVEAFAESKNLQLAMLKDLMRLPYNK